MRHSSTPGRRGRLAYWLLLSVLALPLATGCTSSRPSFQFRPGAAVLPPAAPPTPAAAPTLPPPPMPASPAVAAAKNPSPKRAAARAQAQLVRRLRPALARASQLQPSRQRQGNAATARHVSWPNQPREVGLGTTVLGVLGLVVLPVSLLGLLIWGGPVWAVLAGLAALAVLVAYLDPFA